MKKSLFPLFVAFCCFLTVSKIYSFETLPEKYCISFGNSQAQVKIVEYFSLSCPKCITLIKRDFPYFLEKYVKSSQVFWVFHPDPADILTIQFLECLEKLSEKEKREFFKYVVEILPKTPSKKTVFEMQKVLAEWGRPIPHLHDLKFLEETETFQSAFSYIKQEDAPKEIPTISINEEIKEAFPTHTFVEKEIQKVLEEKNPYRKGRLL